jgi:aspartyl-tRNA(Asn)/glutamyl-tRNA(Gln) amidotransferase subunit C
VIKLVTREEIEKVAKLMRIELDDHTVHIDRVQKMIEYFDVLDNAGIESEEFDVQEKSITELREDEHIPFDEKLIEKLKSFKGTYVRAPKMV